MSQENLELIRRLYNECWVNANFDLLPVLLHPEIVWTAIESAPDAGARRGYRECRAYMEDWLDDFEMGPLRIEATAMTGDGQLACDQLGAATGKGSGLRTEIRFGAVFRFSSDGRIRGIAEYATFEEALEAAGLSE